MTDSQLEQPAAASRPSSPGLTPPTPPSLTQQRAQPQRQWSGRLALVVALLALAVTAAQWLGVAQPAGQANGRSEELAKTQRRLSALEDRLQRERDDLNQLTATLGAEAGDEGSVSGRLSRIEEALDRGPGGGQVRSLWMLQQAEYFLRIANAQENLAGDSVSALTALEMADEHLREAADPRLLPVRKLVASEMAALRALPRVDVEGLVLQLGTLSELLPSLPRRQTAPAQFRVEPEPPAPEAQGFERALHALRNALLSIVSVRRTDAPPATLLTEESAGLLMRSLDLELQMARLSLLRGEAALYRASLAAVRRDIEQYFAADAASVASALTTLDELAKAPLPESRPDVSASLAALLKFREAEQRS